MQSISFYSLLVLSIAGPSFIHATPTRKITDVANINSSIGNLDLLGFQTLKKTSTGGANNQNEVKDNDNIKTIKKDNVNSGRSKVQPKKTHDTTKEVKDNDYDNEKKHGHKEHDDRHHGHDGNHNNEEYGHRGHQSHGYDENDNNNHGEHYHGRHHEEHKEHNYDF